LLRLVLCAAAVATSLGQAAAQDRIGAVATFSILADLVKNVGGERVEVTPLVGPDADAHVYSPSPADSRKIAAAKVVFANGLGYEGWMDRLVRAAGRNVNLVIVTRGIAARRGGADGHKHGGSDPHAWQSVTNAKIYVANIRDALNQAEPAGKDIYDRNAADYIAKLDALDSDVKAAIAAIPADRRRIITTHDAFNYFGAAYGIEVIAPQGVSTEAEPSARDVARIIAQIRRQKIPAVFMENITDDRQLRRIAAESGARIGGRLYSDALSAPTGPAGSYIAMMRSNLQQLQQALQK
jgi:zinc/manganese transport system substrate-binding protein